MDFTMFKKIMILFLFFTKAGDSATSTVQEIQDIAVQNTIQLVKELDHEISNDTTVIYLDDFLEFMAFGDIKGKDFFHNHKIIKKMAPFKQEYLKPFDDFLNTLCTSHQITYLKDKWTSIKKRKNFYN